MTQPPLPGSTFVVGIDTAEVLRRRSRVRRIQRVGGWSAVLVIVVAMVPGLLWITAFDDELAMGLVMMAIPLPVLFVTLAGIHRVEQRNGWYAASELPPFAIRMSPPALELGVEGAPVPVVLPWSAVRGFRHETRFRQPVLSLALEPGVDAATAGVSGLDQPAARDALLPGKLVKPIGFYGVAALDQPLPAIDQALRRYSDGRAGII